MDDLSRKRSSRGAQIDDLPPPLIIDILSRLPTPSLLSSRVACKSWYILSSDPLFVELHLARSPTHLIRQRDPNILFPDAASLDFEFNCVNSSNGLLCLEDCKSGGGEIYVCNPILGEYITIPTGTSTDKETESKSVLGFNSRSNQFKVLRITSLKLDGRHWPEYMAEIYTIGDGTLHWKNIGIAPFCYNFTLRGSTFVFLNGSIHWAHAHTPRIVYFNLDTEQFGSLPSPPAWESYWARIDVVDGCLSFLADPQHGNPGTTQLWVMKEYGVEESWTRVSREFRELFRLCYGKSPRRQFGLCQVTYNPSFISLRDVAKGEQFTSLSRTGTVMGCSSQRLSDYLRSRRLFCLGEETASEIHIDS